jgi:C-methyltransferase
MDEDLALTAGARREFTLSRRITCRLCGAPAPDLVFSLPAMPLAGFPVVASSPIHDQRYPVDVHACGRCGLVQLLDILPDAFYQEYRYTPSHAAGFVGYIQHLARDLHRRFRPERVVEIGSSDGALIGTLQSLGVRVLGFEPSTELAASASRQGIPTVPSYFTPQTVTHLDADFRPVDVVVARHVLEHIDDLSGVFSAIDAILDSQRGVLVLEVPYLGTIISEHQYYAFFNEHVSYFSLATMRRLLARHGFSIAAARSVFPEGGSILVFASRGNSTAAPPGQDVDDDDVLCDPSTFQRFAERLDDFRARMRAFVDGAHDQRRRLAAWGAGQRGASLLNICQLTADDIECVVDVNPAYQGLCTPGSRIPIVSPADIYHRRPDGIMVFATGYLDSIRSEHRSFEERGGRFISIVPQPRWLDAEGALA